MKTYCLSCKKKTANQTSSVTRTKQNKIILLSNCTVCGEKKSNFIKNEEARRLEDYQVVFNNCFDKI